MSSKDVIHRWNVCRGCASRDLDLIFALRPTPIGDAYVTKEKVGVEQPLYPIDLFMCEQCGLAQLLDVIDPDVLYGDYLYVTGSSFGLAEHFAAYARHVVDRCRLVKGSLVVDLGSNDGTLLRPYKALGMDVAGVEPALHIAAEATRSGIPTYGPGQFIRSLTEKGEMRLFGDGGELCDLLYVDDLARVAVDLALGPRIGDFNVAGGAILHLRRPSQVPESAGRQGSDRPGRSSHREDGSAARRVEAAPRAAPRALHAARHGPLGGVSRRARSPFGLVSTVSRPVVRRFFIGRTCSRVIKPESEGKMWLECQTTVTLPSLSPTEVRHPRLPQNESFTSRLRAIAASLAVRACAAGVSSPSDRTAKSDGQCHRYSG